MREIWWTSKHHFKDFLKTTIVLPATRLGSEEMIEHYWDQRSWKAQIYSPSKERKRHLKISGNQFPTNCLAGWVHSNARAIHALWRGIHNLLQHHWQVLSELWPLSSAARGNDYSFSFCRHSFNEAVEYRNLIAKVRASEEVPVILVANKVGGGWRWWWRRIGRWLPPTMRSSWPTMQWWFLVVRVYHCACGRCL